MTLAVGVMPAVTKLFCAPLSNIKNKLIVDIEETRKNISIVPANTPLHQGDLTNILVGRYACG